MDASAFPKVDADNNEVYSLFLKIENTEFPTPIRQRNTVIKYTKLPEFDFEAKGSWLPHSYTLRPHLRRIITLEDPEVATTRSLKTNLFPPKATTTTNFNKRKIVTISEDDEYDLHPKFSKDTRRSTTHRSVSVDLDKETKQYSRKSTSRQVTSARYLKETRPSAKSNSAFDRKENTPKSNYKRPSNINKVASESRRPRNVKEKETMKSSKYVTSSRSSLSKKVTCSESENEISAIREKLYENLQNIPIKKYNERSKVSRSPPRTRESKSSFIQERKKYKPFQTIIHVPLEEKYQRQYVISRCIASGATEPVPVDDKCNRAMDTGIVLYKDMNIGTEPLPCTVDQETETDIYQPELVQNVQNTGEDLLLQKEKFDNLDIPNVSLKPEKNECREKLFDIQSMSLPNLEVPECQVTPKLNENSFLDTRYCKSTSYIISKAILTYRTKQKINFQVVDSNDSYSNQSPSPLSYPMNVVSVFKEDSSSKDISNNISMEEKPENKTGKEFKNCINDIKSLDCSYVSNSDKLMKPSDIISTIRVNNGLLQSDYMCDQFQRELNFIDSFFESLQYLESCSFSEKCFNKNNIDVVNNSSLLKPGFDVKNSEYDNFWSKFENVANNDDTETMASKNLFLLNILIRDEQRRAKKLLFVLKRREDALKDFTKSQILYLESKKKQDNTDISTLKKKQRGALLKLQHECGEMQRMRKALLTLSEKRKLALMKTKKDLELKLKSNVDVEQIILGKKKVKRSSGADRTSPLKCFDLSSSGCEDSSTSRCSTDSTSSVSEDPGPVNPIISVEKSIQTGDSIFEAIDHSTDTAAENFITVDGGYLNILFQNLSLPQIFSGGKQYEVNEEALKNIINSTNSRQRETGSEIVEKLMDQINNKDTDKSSTPSTARSLVEEFDQYYKGLAEDHNSFDEDSDFKTSPQVNEIIEATVQYSECKIAPCENQSASTINTDSTQTIVEAAVLTRDESCECDVIEEEQEKTPVEISPTGPLPVPEGAPDVPDTVVMEAPTWLPTNHTSQPSSNTTLESSSASSESLCEMVSSMSSLAAPVHTEAEELRRQQLAIEQEIKELEQQQCRLLVVREIPDKPPPPYTPPGDARPQPPRPFRADELALQQIRTVVENPTTVVESTDAFDVFVHDFCHECLERAKPEQSDNPWDSCNLLPQKPPPDIEKVVDSTSSELVEVLAGVTPVVSGVSSRRSDHIDDLLFAEWRRIEPEWTSLHTDEAVVKNQLFEIIFQRILTETFDEYKQTVRELAD